MSEIVLILKELGAADGCSVSEKTEKIPGTGSGIHAYGTGLCV
jgi:hypothetical protein